MRFKAEAGGPSVMRVLRAVALLHLLLPLFVLAAVTYRPHIRSWPALAVMAGSTLVFVLCNTRDFRRLRQGRFEEFAPWPALVEVLLATTAYGSAAVTVGLHGDAFLLMVCVPFLTTSVMGNPAMMTLAWVATTTALAVDTGLQVPALDAVWATALFAATFGMVGVVVDMIVRGAMLSSDLHGALANLASQAGTLQAWPEDLLPLASDLAAAMGVDRYVVLSADGPDRPPTPVLWWPEPGWALEGAVSDAATLALAQDNPPATGGLEARAQRTTTTEVVVVVPARLRSEPVDTTLVTTAAALLAAMHERALLIGGLVNLANTDPLTGVANRRQLFETLQLELARCGRQQLPLSVAMIDLDHFKDFNDRFGHAAGDRLLRRFSHGVRTRLRAQDLVARYGGEEFFLVLPDTSAEGASNLVDGIRSAGAGFDPGGGRVTFSAGIATWDPAETVDELVFRADTNLYAAKSNGRDCVVSRP